MKKFEMPEIQLDVFHMEDVVTVSVITGENESPFQPAY